MNSFQRSNKKTDNIFDNNNKKMGWRSITIISSNRKTASVTITNMKCYVKWNYPSKYRLNVEIFTANLK